MGGEKEGWGGGGNGGKEGRGKGTNGPLDGKVKFLLNGEELRSESLVDVDDVHVGEGEIGSLESEFDGLPASVEK